MNRRRAKRCVSIGMALALLAESLGCGHDPGNSSRENDGRVVVRVVAARWLEMADRVSGLGRCEALPDRLATLTPLVEGRVEKILAAQGQQVAAGQPIVQLDTTVAQADLAEKEAARNGLVASLTRLKSLPRPEEQQAAKLAIEDAQIAVARAQSVVDRSRPLRARNEISEQQMFEAEQTLSQAQLQQQTAEAKHQVMMLGPRSEEVAEAQAKIDMAEKGVASSRAKLDLHIIRAPIDGFLDRLECHPGQTLAAGTVIGQVVDSRRVFVTAWLPVRKARRVRVGQSAVIEPDSAAASADRSSADKPLPRNSKVVFVGRVVDRQTGNLPVRTEVDNADNQLAVGQIVSVSISVAEPASVIAVPLTAVHDEGKGRHVTVVRDGKAVVLTPQFGLSDDGWIAALGTDLKDGEPVIVEGAYNLPDGTEVTTSPQAD